MAMKQCSCFIRKRNAAVPFFVVPPLDSYLLFTTILKICGLTKGFLLYLPYLDFPTISSRSFLYLQSAGLPRIPDLPAGGATWRCKQSFREKETNDKGGRRWRKNKVSFYFVKIFKRKCPFVRSVNVPIKVPVQKWVPWQQVTMFTLFYATGC